MSDKTFEWILAIILLLMLIIIIIDEAIIPLIYSIAVLIGGWA